MIDDLAKSIKADIVPNLSNVEKVDLAIALMVIPIKGDVNAA